MAIFETAVSFISIHAGSFTSFCNEPFTSLLLPHLKMNRLSRLDSSSSSDHDDDDQQTHPWCTTSSSYSIPGYAYSTVGGSVPGRQYTHRDREAGHWRLYNDYFSEAPTYDASIFWRRCVKLSFFPRLLHAAI